MAKNWLTLDFFSLILSTNHVVYLNISIETYSDPSKSFFLVFFHCKNWLFFVWFWARFLWSHISVILSPILMLSGEKDVKKPLLQIICYQFWRITEPKIFMIFFTGKNFLKIFVKFQKIERKNFKMSYLGQKLTYTRFFFTDIIYKPFSLFWYMCWNLLRSL